MTPRKGSRARTGSVRQEVTRAVTHTGPARPGRTVTGWTKVIRVLCKG
ncbi:hypothetical protein [Streptomyces spirodelae]|uniref:Uncharacterized protein n=1 Tax=Streptomyces spirodelae TaxID=2812904 RepID=A0ABS3WY43_9ACTN|nr:hypothetical protein [Streptomyces spirodelae]MBO8188050.1 hypothetical protein [Streptomyces spirodelae]